MVEQDPFDFIQIWYKYHFYLHISIFIVYSPLNPQAANLQESNIDGKFCLNLSRSLGFGTDSIANFVLCVS